MTIHEAIEQLKSLLDHCKTMRESGEVWVRDCEALGMALAALRGPTREQVEKVWRGEWISYLDGEHIMPERYYSCSKCGDRGYLSKKNFCDFCGAPMTDEAVQMMMKRLEALHENDH